MGKFNIKLFYNFKDIYRRVGKSGIVDNKYKYFKVYPTILKNEDNYENIVYGSKICLKSMFGYIPVENIKSYMSLFNPNNYCKDITDMIFSYEDTYKNRDDIANVNKLSKTLGSFWRDNNC